MKAITTPAMDMMGQVTENQGRDKTLEEILNSLTYRPYRVKVSKKGRVLEVSGTDQVIEQAFIDLPFGSYDQRQEVINQVSYISGEQSIAGRSVVFPEEAIAPGQKWNTETRITGGFTGTFLNSFELKEIHNHRVLTGGTSELSIDEERTGFDYMGMAPGEDMKGNMFSIVKIDRHTGWLSESDIFREMDGLVFLAESPEILRGTEIKMKTMARTKTEGGSK